MPEVVWLCVQVGAGPAAERLRLLRELTARLAPGGVFSHGGSDGTYVWVDPRIDFESRET